MEHPLKYFPLGTGLLLWPGPFRIYHEPCLHPSCYSRVNTCPIPQECLGNGEDFPELEPAFQQVLEFTSPSVCDALTSCFQSVRDNGNLSGEHGLHYYDSVSALPSPHACL